MAFFLAKTAKNASEAAMIGLIYSENAKVSTQIVVGIAIISAIANKILKYMVYSRSPTKQTRRKYYAGTNFIVNSVTICALAYFDMIGKKGVCLLGFLAVSYANKISSGQR